MADDDRAEERNCEGAKIHDGGRHIHDRRVLSLKTKRTIRPLNVTPNRRTVTTENHQRYIDAFGIFRPAGADSSSITFDS